MLTTGIICAAAASCYLAAAGLATQKQHPVKASVTDKKNLSQNPGFAVSGARRTANMMGYEDTEVNPVLRKYLDFIPHAPGNLLDLGCAWGFTVQQILAIENKTPFLRPRNRKLIAVDMNREHLERVASDSNTELVETLAMHFPNVETEQCKKKILSGHSWCHLCWPPVPLSQSG